MNNNTQKIVVQVNAQKQTIHWHSRDVDGLSCSAIPDCRLSSLGARSAQNLLALVGLVDFLEMKLNIGVFSLDIFQLYLHPILRPAPILRSSRARMTV